MDGEGGGDVSRSRPTVCPWDSKDACDEGQ